MAGAGAARSIMLLAIVVGATGCAATGRARGMATSTPAITTAKAHPRDDGKGALLPKERPAAVEKPAATGDGAVEEGMASWYGKEQQGGPTASGERYDMNQLTAAHRHLKMNTRVRVERVDDGRSVVVRINDRGPYGRGRIIDVSYAAAKQLGMIERGVVRVRVTVVK